MLKENNYNCFLLEHIVESETVMFKYLWIMVRIVTGYMFGKKTNEFENMKTSYVSNIPLFR